MDVLTAGKVLANRHVNRYNKQGLRSLTRPYGGLWSNRYILTSNGLLTYDTMACTKGRGGEGQRGDGGESRVGSEEEKGRRGSDRGREEEDVYPK